MKTACVLLAAGTGSRYGGEKLDAVIGGTTLLDRASAVHLKQNYEFRVAVVSENLKERIVGFDSVAVNRNPERGISSSIRIGIEEIRCLERERGIQLDGVLFGVSDQPFLKSETVADILKTFAAHPDRIVAPASEDGRRGNPVVFPAALLRELSLLTGDTGGSSVIRKHLELLLTVPAERSELADIDTRQDENALQNGAERA